MRRKTGGGEGGLYTQCFPCSGFSFQLESELSWWRNTRRRKEEKKQVFRSLRKPSTTSRPNPNLADPLHSSSHGRSLRGLNNNNGDHHCFVSVGSLITSSLNRIPYWNIECLEGVFAVADLPGPSIPSMTLFFTNGVSPGIRSRISLRHEKLGKVGPGRVSV